MGNRWTVDQNDKLEKYEWHNPGAQQETDTTVPGSLDIKPNEFTLKPTRHPATTGIQSGVNEWTYSNAPDTSWYIYGGIVQED